MIDESNDAEESQSRLKSCKLCGNGLSPYSPLCRHCGHPQGSVLALWLLGGFLLLLIAFYVSMTLFCLYNVHRYPVCNEQVAESPRRDVQ